MLLKLGEISEKSALRIELNKNNKVVILFYDLRCVIIRLSSTSAHKSWLFSEKALRTEFGSTDLYRPVKQAVKFIGIYDPRFSMTISRN